MAKVLVLFHSRTGTTAALADAIAEGARSVRFTEVDVRRLGELRPESAAATPHRALDDAARLADYDALVLGGPAHPYGLPTEVATLLDALQPMVARGELTDRVGAAFTTAPASLEGASADAALQGMLAAMGALGMILAPPGGAAPGRVAGTPWGASATTGAAPTDDELAAARDMGARVARIAGWVRHAKGHEQGQSHTHSHGDSHSHGDAHSHDHGHHHH